MPKLAFSVKTELIVWYCHALVKKLYIASTRIVKWLE